MKISTSKMPVTCNQCNKILSKGSLKQHLWAVHDVGGGKIFTCSEEGCGYTCKSNGRLKKHLWQVHDVGEGKIFTCSEDGCGYTSKNNSSLKRHLWRVHDVGEGKIFTCSEDGCDYTSKNNGDLKRHLECVHDVGTKICDYCFRNCFRRIQYKDVNVGNVHICRKCFRKSTGFKSRAEEQMVNIFEGHPILSPYIILKDKIIAHDACDTRRRPDLLISSCNIHFILECDEYQHKRGNYTFECESGRLDEIIDEFKTGKIVWVRWNPDSYKTYGPRDSRKVRLEKLVDLIMHFVKHPPSSHISVHYMYYDRDSPLIVDRWPFHFHN